MEAVTEAPVTINFIVTISGQDAEDLRGFYKEAHGRYTAWTTRLVDRLKDYGTIKTEIAEHEQRMENMVASWVREGVEGRNEREREAVLTGIKESDQAYVFESVEQAKKKRQLLIDIEPSLEEAKYLRRLAEEDIKWSTASLLALAGFVEAGRSER